jgi:hypothetical protein
MAIVAPQGPAPMELQVDLGPMPEDPQRGGVLSGLRGLLEAKEMCDVVLMVGGQSLWAHRVMLAAASPSLRSTLLGGGSAAPCHVDAVAGATVIRLEEVTHPEAVQAMLDCIYGAAAVACGVQGHAHRYNVSTDEVNRDVIWLARRFQIAPLLEQASQWVLVNLTTSNLLRRLVLCEEFCLGEVRDKVLEQLVSNPDALFEMAQDPEITKVPGVLQDLLVRILSLLHATVPDNAKRSPCPPRAPAIVAAEITAQKVIQGKQVHGGKVKKAGA